LSFEQFALLVLDGGSLAAERGLHHLGVLDSGIHDRDQLRLRLSAPFWSEPYSAVEICDAVLNEIDGYCRLFAVCLFVVASGANEVFVGDAVAIGRQLDAKSSSLIGYEGLDGVLHSGHVDQVRSVTELVVTERASGG
jgi:hypothetical protein